MVRELIQVVDLSDGGDGEGPVVGAGDEGLRLKIRNAPDTHVSAHFLHVVLKLRAEGAVFDIVDRTVETVLTVYDHTCPAGSEM